MDRTQYLQIRSDTKLEKDPWALASFATRDLLLYASAFTLMWLGNAAAKLFAIPIFSILMFRNFSQMHDAVHGSSSKSRSLNSWVGIISGGVCLLPFTQWRQIHLEHHKWSGNIDKDPVTAIIRRFPGWSKPAQDSSTALWKAWIPVLAVFQYFVFWFYSVKYSISNWRAKGAFASVLSPVIIWTAIVHFSPGGALFEVLIPAAFLYLIAVEVVNFPHHLGLPQNHEETKLPVWDQYAIARSCIYPKWISRGIVLNFNYHIEHHMFPDVPWYRLEALHRVVKERLGAKYNTDPQFAWILRNRKRHLSEVLAAAPGAAPQEEPKAA